ncbi:MAG: class I SAM-dependent methyltransferase [Holosporaceae bacterium]|jgi:SAM-dependent methyltransferase|nr:class I SAM-dependent methyltransferase [Holosporaceae bacterium]
MLCHICGSDTSFVGIKKGKYSVRDFEFRECKNCGFAFVSNPITDCKSLYNEEYYHGHGADPSVDYVSELLHPNTTIRRFEWYGITEMLGNLFDIEGGGGSKKWLDIGCGNGALVRYALSRNINCVGAEEGWIADKVRTEFSIPIIPFDDIRGTYDIITAIEVIEHIQYPLEFLQRLKQFMKPNGLFFYTTGNSSPFRNNLLKWSYVCPEVHISYFNPHCMKIALEKTGFKAIQCSKLPAGMEYIILFKVLKTFGVKQFKMSDYIKSSSIFRFLIKIGASLVNKKYQISNMPIGICK